MWTTLTTADALEELTSQETAALNQIKGGETFAGILDRAVAEFRGSIFAGGHALGEEGTIPDSLKGHCIALARWRFLISIGKNDALQTAHRKDAHDRALTLLDSLAAGKRAVEPAGSGTFSRSGNWNSANKILPRVHPVPRPGTQQTATDKSYANPDGPGDLS